MTHELLASPDEFAAIKLGVQRFIICPEVFDFKAGDKVILSEDTPPLSDGSCNRDEIALSITNIAHGTSSPQFGLKDGWAIMSVMIL